VSRHRKDPKRVLAARKAAQTRRRDDDAMAGTIITDPLFARCPCGERCQIAHDRDGLSYLACMICGASTRDTRRAAAS
jgi:hypothetical protein